LGRSQISSNRGPRQPQQAYAKSLAAEAAMQDRFPDYRSRYKLSYPRNQLALHFPAAQSSPVVAASGMKSVRWVLPDGQACTRCSPSDGYARYRLLRRPVAGQCRVEKIKCAYPNKISRVAIASTNTAGGYPCNYVKTHNFEFSRIGLLQKNSEKILYCERAGGLSGEVLGDQPGSRQVLVQGRELRRGKFFP
jgi:hypothetical protein